jgi:hypothetical protein
MCLTPKRKCLIIGASHAKKLSKAIINNKEFTKQFDIFTSCQSGALSTDLDFPQILKEFTENDVVLILAFGNDIFVRHTITTRTPFKIHLTKFEKVSETKLQQNFEYIKSKIKDLKCRVILLDNIYRHLYCCPEHVHKGIAKYQVLVNQQIKSFFGTQSINHLYLFDQQRKFRNRGFYSTLLVDSVHFKEEYYSEIAKNLLNRISHHLTVQC